MTISLRSSLTAGVAVVAASAMVAAPSLAAPLVSRPVTSHTVELAAAVAPLWPKPDNIPTLADEVRRGIVPSLGAAFPTPNIPAPAPAATNVNQAVKNIYNAAEPWVRYGFEVATYAVGWVPYVGWLAPQIMIFYNFGERIVRSITFNVDDWLFGPLPFGQGLGNVARDSWNALVQLGIDQWNFWLPPLPPLPPLPFTAQQTPTPAADLTATQQQRGQTPLAEIHPSLSRHVGSQGRPAKKPAVGYAAAARRVVAQVEQPLGNGGTGIVPVNAAGPVAAGGLPRAVPGKESARTTLASRVVSAPLSSRARPRVTHNEKRVTHNEKTGERR